LVNAGGAYRNAILDTVIGDIPGDQFQNVLELDMQHRSVENSNDSKFEFNILESKWGLLVLALALAFGITSSSGSYTLPNIFSGLIYSSAFVIYLHEIGYVELFNALKNKENRKDSYLNFVITMFCADGLLYIIAATLSTMWKPDSSHFGFHMKLAINLIISTYIWHVGKRIIKTSKPNLI
jgi:hypothetical protein